MNTLTRNLLYLFPAILLASCDPYNLEHSNPLEDASAIILTITSPNGGENWTVASSHNITWTTTGTVANVKLEYTSNGSTWNVITTSTTNTNTYAWTVPNAVSTACKVRVTDVTNSSVTDMSNANFTITTSGGNTVTDIDGNVYHIVTIGTKQWLVENLKTRHYRNGDSIPNVTSSSTWSGLTTGAYCDYENSSSNGATYGHLYNWYAVNDSRGLAPTGWHVATDAEWTTLVNYVGGESVAGAKLKSTSGWNGGGNGTNDYGFTALPGGYRNSEGNFSNYLSNAYWWTNDQYSALNAWRRYLYYASAAAFRDNENKHFGKSIRCVRD